ncbi:type II toxin-antitoxin system RelE/ParE family toxin [Paeniglutamicibacter gangotriensis]
MRAPERAARFVITIAEYCGNLAAFPLIGTARDDIRPGMRTIGFRRLIVIAFAVTDETVEILGVYYGGRGYESLFSATWE